MAGSGGARVFAASAANQISSAIRVFFSISDMTWGPLFFPPFPCPLTPCHPTFPLPPLEVGPLNPDRSGGAL